jgi:hypothetical protein
MFANLPKQDNEEKGISSRDKTKNYSLMPYQIDSPVEKQLN